MYSVGEFGLMISDQRRMSYWAAAIAQVVQPGATVLDLGTGTGIMAFLACRAGAEHVFAVDTAQAIHLARQVARDNGFADRITFLQQDSRELELPDRVDVLMADLHGSLPYFRGNVRTLVDARERLLRPGGQMMGEVDRVSAVPVEHPEARASYERPWSERPYGLDMSAVLASRLSTWGKQRVRPEHLLAEPAVVHELDYRTIVSPDVTLHATFEVQRPGSLDGWALWFDETLAPGIDYSNHPAEEEMIYGQAFFPLEREQLVEPGDQVDLELQVTEGEDYECSWRSTVLRPGQEPVVHRQSTFNGNPMGLAQWKQQAPGYRPRLSRAGKAERAALLAMDGSSSISDVTAAVTAECPWLTPEAAGRLVRRLAVRLAS